MEKTASILVVLCLALTACESTISKMPETPGAPNIATQTPALVSPSPTTPPTTEPTIESTAAALTLDKPMTTEFSIDETKMPSVTQENISSGQLGATVNEHFKQTGLTNPDGTANKPANVVAADQWKIFVSDGSIEHNVPAGDETLIPKFNQLPSGADFPFQPTNLLFKLVDGSGKVKGIIVTEILYYQDKATPVFFFVSQDKVNPTYESTIMKSFGHPKAGDAYKIAVPYLGVKPGTTGSGYVGPLTQEQDISVYLNDPQEPNRVNFANQVVDKQNLEGIDRFLWAVITTVG